MSENPIEEAGSETPPQENEAGGTAGAAEEVTTDVETETDPELKDYGAPAPADEEADPAEEAGSSGAEEGIHEWSPEAYEPAPEDASGGS